MSKVVNSITRALGDGRWLQLSGSIAEIATRDHDLLAGLGDDDHTIYALLAGRSGGQTLNGSNIASQSLTIRGTSNANLGTIIPESPIDLQLQTIVSVLVNPAYAIRDLQNFTTPTGAVVMGGINSNKTLTVNTGVWFCSQIADQSTYILTTTPTFSAFTLFNAFPKMTNLGFSGNTNLTGSIGIQIAIEHENEFATTTTTDIDYALQHRPTANQNLAGGSMTNVMSVSVRCAPEIFAVAGGSAGHTIIYGLRMENVAFSTGHAGTQILGTYCGLRVENITNKLASSVICGVDSALVAGTNNYFLRNTGGAQSLITGAITLRNDLIFENEDSGLLFGEIWVEGNVATMSVSSAGFTQVVVFDTNGQSNNTTPDHTTDDITVDVEGKYLVTLSMALLNSSGSSHVLDIHVGGNNNSIVYSNLHAHRTLGTGSDVGSISISGIIDVAATTTLEVWISSDSGAARNITVQDATLSIVQIGGT